MNNYSDIKKQIYKDINKFDTTFSADSSKFSKLKTGTYTKPTSISKSATIDNLLYTKRQQSSQLSNISKGITRVAGALLGVALLLAIKNRFFSEDESGMNKTADDYANQIGDDLLFSVPEPDFTQSILDEKQKTGYVQATIGGHRTSEEMLAEMRKRERFEAAPYPDPEDLAIGYGHHGLIDGKPITLDMRITKAKAEEVFRLDVAKFENYVNRVVKVPVTQAMFDAMVDYSFNVGSLGPKFLRYINSRNYAAAVKELTTKNEGLRSRRKMEQDWFIRGVSFDSSGNIIGMLAPPTTISTPTIAQTPTRPPTKSATIGGKGVTVTGQGRHVSKDSSVTLSESAISYLRQIEGSDVITSGMEGSLHAQTSKTGYAHAYGNKLDIRTRDSSEYVVMQRMYNYAVHPATHLVTLEYSDGARARRILSAFRANYPQLSHKVKIMALKKGNGEHLDVSFNPALIPHIQDSNEQSNDLGTWLLRNSKNKKNQL